MNKRESRRRIVDVGVVGNNCSFFCRLLFFCSCRMSKRKISYSATCAYDEDALLTITDTNIQ